MSPILTPAGIIYPANDVSLAKVLPNPGATGYILKRNNMAFTDTIRH